MASETLVEPTAEAVLAPSVQQELFALTDDAKDGLLRPEVVVSFAKDNPESALHAEFEWDVNKAAERHWLDTARRLIRAQVTIMPQTHRRSRAFVSVPTDRMSGDGYRRTDRAVADNRLRVQLAEEALKVVEAIPQRFSHLPELDPLWSELRAAVDRYRAALVNGMAAA
jgi:hypothetical protein